MTRVALIHDWLTGMRGGEYVFEAIAELFPQAELFTLICIPDKISKSLSSMKRHTSWLQKIPGAEKKYRHFLPWMPSMIESFDLSGFDLIISSSHCVAKGIRKPQNSLHISYVHAPMRYMWDRYNEYFAPGQSSLAVRAAAWLVRSHLQEWDFRVSQSDRTDLIIANSHYIAGQIQKHYQRPAQIIHPFADLSRFLQPRNPENFYLMVTAFAPYKRIDLAIEAFNQMKLPLWIVGSGQDEEKLRKMAGPTIRFLGSLTNSEVAQLYSTCRAFIFPGIEDFGITPLEALASGAPVIALKDGGATETVDPSCGLFFYPQTLEHLVKAVQKFEQNPNRFSEQDCRKHAATFSKTRFQTEFLESVQSTWTQSGRNLASLQQAMQASENRLNKL